MRVDLPIVSFMSAVLVLIPLPWHWRAHHIATVSLIIWLALTNIIRGVNSIIWGGNVTIRYEVWCDITTNIQTAANFGIPASVLSINRYLAWVVSPNREIFTKNARRQNTRFDVGMCIILPLVFAPLHYIVQHVRFVVYEDIGCLAGSYPSIAGLIVYSLPPVLLSFAGVVYAGIALRWLIQRRDQHQFIQPPRATLTSGRYFRLVALCIVEMVVCSTMSVFLLSASIEPGFLPWISWEYIHEDSMIAYAFAHDSLSEPFWATQMLVWYFVPIASVIFFGFFGFAFEALMEYKKGCTWVGIRLLSVTPNRTPPLPTNSHDVIATSDPNTPIHVTGRGSQVEVPELGEWATVHLSHVP